MVPCRHVAPMALAILVASSALAQPELVFDIAAKDPDAGDYMRGFGFDNNGQFGTPVAGGFDMDGDGKNDSALALMLAEPGGLVRAGRVVLFFGDGTIHGEVDGSIRSADVLHIEGTQTRQNVGCEVWMGDVTGDGLGDLLICHQNYTPAAGRTGAGGLSIIVGSQSLRTYTATEQPYSLGAPPATVAQVDIIGRNEFDRLGVWARVGDVDGDGIDDVVVAADQSDVRGTHSGELWVIRGGPHLASTQTLDLIGFGTDPALAGNVARIVPPTATEQHLGSTLHVHDLDGNDRADIVACADALNRSGATLAPAGGSSTTTHGSSQESRDGAGWIVWDDNFPAAPWAAGLTIDLASPTGSTSRIDGPASFASFGEEVIGGLDFDNDGNADLLFADLTASSQRGQAKVLYNAPLLKNHSFDLDNAENIPAGVTIVTITGPSTGAIGLDTVMQGDFNGDGIGDLAIGNPQDDPSGRFNAGTIHVLYGRDGFWPSDINLQAGLLPPTSELRIAQINGRFQGDVLCYSAAYGDVDGDGRTDIITNEMNGDSPSGDNVGNLIVIPGSRLLDPPPVAEGTEWFVIE